MKPPRDGWDADEREALQDVEEELDALRTRHDHDPPIDLLRAGHQDALPEDLQSDVTGFLATNAWSRTLVEGLAAAETSLTAEEREQLLARIQTRAAETAPPVARWRWLPPVFAGVALAAMVVLAVSIWPETPPPAASPTLGPAREMAAARPTPDPRLPLDKPEIILSTGALTWRGTTPENPLLAALRPGIEAFRAGDYARADRELDAIESQYPASVEVVFYQGVARLFLNDAAGAIESLQKAATLADVVFAPEVDWYRAVAEQRAGHPTQARARLDRLCRGTSKRAGAACEALK